MGEGALSTLSVEQLKNCLGEFKLALSGKKDALIERLEEYLRTN